MVVDEISPKRLILSDIRVLKVLYGEEDRNYGVPVWPEDPKVGSPVSTRNGCDAMISRHVTLDVKDVNTCPRDEKTDLRGGRASFPCSV